MYPNIPKIESLEIPAINRKLKATWSYETARDLLANCNAQAEQEIADLLAKEISDLKDLAEYSKIFRPDMPKAPEEKPWGFRKKKRIVGRSITEDWQPSAITYDE